MASDIKSKENSRRDEGTFETERTTTFDVSQVNFTSAPDTEVGAEFSTNGEEGRGFRDSRFHKVELETIYEVN